MITQLNSEKLQTARTSAAWRNCRNTGKIIVKGNDRIDLLNRLSTNELKDLNTGIGRQTVFSTTVFAGDRTML